MTALEFVPTPHGGAPASSASPAIMANVIGMALGSKTASKASACADAIAAQHAKSEHHG